MEIQQRTWFRDYSVKSQSFYSISFSYAHTNLYRDRDLPELVAKVAQSREDILGPRQSRTPTSIWFEQQPRASAVKKGQRCYGLFNMAEQPRLAEGPPASFKVNADTLDDTQIVVKKALSVKFCSFSLETN